MKNTLTLRANAKINIGLNITAKRDDGYHEVETLMHSVSLFDTLEFYPSNETVIASETYITQNVKDNIVYKCIEKIKAYSGVSSGLSVKIDKKIPVQAGLGGGSADGAAALVAFNEIYGLKLQKSELAEIGASVGADIPFCIYGGCALCTGIGEIIKEQATLDGISCVIIMPDVGIDTKTAYEFTDNNKTENTAYSALLPLLRSEKKGNGGRYIHNAFEAYAFSSYPQLKAVKEALYENGAFAAGLTGSGSALYGLFDDSAKKEKTVLVLKDRYGSVFKADLCEASIESV